MVNSSKRMVICFTSLQGQTCRVVQIVFRTAVNFTENTYELGISLDFGLAPDVSMYHFPPLILTGKGFTKETLTSKSWPTLASPRVI